MADGHVRAALVPELELAEIDGITVVLGALLATRTGVIVYLYALENDRTRALDEQHTAAFEAWTAEFRDARARGETDPPRHPPEMPGTRLLGHDVRLALRDDVGTEYRWGGTASAGTETEWEAKRQFKPAIPAGARNLTVLAHLKGGRIVKHTLALD